MRIKMHLWQARLVQVLCFIFLVSSIASPQVIKGYWGYKRDKEDVEKLLDMLRCNEKIHRVPEFFLVRCTITNCPILCFSSIKLKKEQTKTPKNRRRKKSI